MLGLFLAALLWSAIAPHDRFTWFLEVAPALIGAVVLAATWRKLPLANLTYFFILLQALVLVVGGKYTYAENPLFAWLQHAMDLERNYYDRLGHFMQGFTPALVAREIILRLGVLNRPGWIYFVVICFCLSVSVAYEFIEWWVALASGEAAEAFLGTQGDVWDTQWDMFMAGVGAVAAMACMTGAQDRSMGKLLGQRPSVRPTVGD
jgi:putative membrane protein